MKYDFFIQYHLNTKYFYFKCEGIMFLFSSIYSNSQMLNDPDLWDCDGGKFNLEVVLFLALFWSMVSFIIYVIFI